VRKRKEGGGKEEIHFAKPGFLFFSFLALGFSL